MPLFVDHIVLNVKDIKRTERFYSKMLGPPTHSDDYSIVYEIGDAKIFFILPYNKLRNNKFSKDRFGLNHLAFGVTTFEELNAWFKKLSRARIKNSGIKIDKYGGKEFIWLDDPDGMRIEFYLRSEE